MNREEVKLIKKGQCIEFRYMPEGEIYTKEVLSVDKEDGFHVHIKGIMKDTLFMVPFREIVSVIDCDTQKAVLV